MRGSLLLINWPPEIVAQTVKPPLDFDPYMSGGMLLAKQTFRRLFRSERVDEREGLGIRQVTFLFTDLKGSTAMYERLGDLNAYALVREHFALLGAVVQEHSGAIVKTIGDAVMAVFSRPADAVAAALHILGDIERYNREHGEPGIILKIGAHCGSSIAVTLNIRILSGSGKVRRLGGRSATKPPRTAARGLRMRSVRVAPSGRGAGANACSRRRTDTRDPRCARRGRSSCRSQDDRVAARHPCQSRTRQSGEADRRRWSRST